MPERKRVLRRVRIQRGRTDVFIDLDGSKPSGLVIFAETWRCAWRNAGSPDNCCSVT